MEKMETFDLGGGWTAERVPAERVGLDALRLNRHGRKVWEMEIPPKMAQTDMLSMAGMLTDFWESAFQDGADACRDYMQQAMDTVSSADVLDTF